MGETIDLNRSCGHRKTVMTDSELWAIIESYVRNLFPDELAGVGATIKTGTAKVFVFEQRLAYCPSCKEILNVPVLRYPACGKEKTAIKKCPDCAGILTLRDNFADPPMYEDQTLNSYEVGKENLAASKSAIRDADTVKNKMLFISKSIILQAEQAILAQANQLPQAVWALLH